MEFVDIVFDAPPGPDSGRFIEVEDKDGRSIKFGEWVERDDGYWALRVPALPLTPPPARDAWEDFTDSTESRIRGLLSQGGSPRAVAIGIRNNARAVHERLGSEAEGEFEGPTLDECIDGLREAEGEGGAPTNLVEVGTKLVDAPASPDAPTSNEQFGESTASPDDSGAGIVGAAIIKADSLVTAGASTAWRGLLCNELVPRIDAARARDKARIEELEFEIIAYQRSGECLAEDRDKLRTQAATDAETIRGLREDVEERIGEYSETVTKMRNESETLQSANRGLSDTVKHLLAENTPAPPSVLDAVEEWQEAVRAERREGFDTVARGLASNHRVKTMNALFALDLPAARKASEASEAVVEAAKQIESLFRDAHPGLATWGDAWSDAHGVLAEAVRAHPEYKAAQEGGE